MEYLPGGSRVNGVPRSSAGGGGDRRVVVRYRHGPRTFCCRPAGRAAPALGGIAAAATPDRGWPGKLGAVEQGKESCPMNDITPVAAATR
jgi:hypothetical protein